MKRTTDALRLVALSRIPRCGGCPRLAAMHDALSNGGFLRAPAPAPPAHCRDPICAPIVRRLEADEPADPPGALRLSAAG